MTLLIPSIQTDTNPPIHPDSSRLGASVCRAIAGPQREKYNMGSSSIYEPFTVWEISL